MKINIILAKDIYNGIGLNNKIPWNITNDLKYFYKLTTYKKSAILMGRKTWESLPKEIKPLQNRFNIVLSRNSKLFHNNIFNVKVLNNIQSAIEFAKEKDFDYLWVIGGSEIYNTFLENSDYDYIFVTKILDNYNCDTFVSENIDKLISIFSSQIYKYNNYKYNFNIYSNKKKNLPEHFYNKEIRENFYFKEDIQNSVDEKYLALVEKIVNEGENRVTRNSETISLFGEHLDISIDENFPLLTTKKVYWKGIVEELLWFLKANTDSKILENKKVNIWKGNTSKEYLETISLEYEEGIGGPIYGWQWRKFNEKYEYTDKDGNKKETIGSNKGFDQLQFIIDEIKNNPTSRRLFMSAWNPNQMKDMCLPPCHISYQFYVNNGYLSCQMYQRSADVFLGLPFNIASTSLLCYLIANICDLKPDRLKICIGDAHIYKNHIEQIKKQLELKNNLFSCPKLIIKNKYSKIEDYTIDDLELKYYYSHPSIKAEMIA